MGNNLDVMRSRDAKQPLSEWLVSCRLIKSVYINSSAINLFWQSLRSVVVGRLPATWNETDKCYILFAFGKSINKIGGVCRLCHHHHVSVWLSVCLYRPVPSIIIWKRGWFGNSEHTNHSNHHSTFLVKPTDCVLCCSPRWMILISHVPTKLLPLSASENRAKNTNQWYFIRHVFSFSITGRLRWRGDNNNVQVWPGTIGMHWVHSRKLYCERIYRGQITINISQVVGRVTIWGMGLG